MEPKYKIGDEVWWPYRYYNGNEYCGYCNGIGKVTTLHESGGSIIGWCPKCGGDDAFLQFGKYPFEQTVQIWACKPEKTRIFGIRKDTTADSETISYFFSPNFDRCEPELEENICSTEEECKVLCEKKTQDFRARVMKRIWRKENDRSLS